VKVGPGINGNFKIMYSGQHGTVTRVPKHGIAPFVKSRVFTAGQLRVTAMNLRNAVYCPHILGATDKMKTELGAIRYKLNTDFEGVIDLHHMCKVIPKKKNPGQC
jgi:hypothetical protein